MPRATRGGNRDFHKQGAGFPLALERDSKDHPKHSWVKISQICTVSTERIGKKIGTVSSEVLDQFMESLDENIGSQPRRAPGQTTWPGSCLGILLKLAGGRLAYTRSNSLNDRVLAVRFRR